MKGTGPHSDDLSGALWCLAAGSLTAYTAAMRRTVSSSPTLSVLALAGTMATVLPGCGGSRRPVAPDEAAPAAAPPRDEQPVIVDAADSLPSRPIKITASAREVGALFDAFASASKTWLPEQVDPRRELNAIGMQLGLGPSALDMFDLRGVFVFETDQDPSGSGDALGMRMRFPMSANFAFADQLANTLGFEPVDGSTWVFAGFGDPLYASQRGTNLYAASSRSDLAQAGALDSVGTTGPRVQLRATDLPPKLGIGSRFLGAGGNVSAALESVLDQATAVSIEMDAGLDRDGVVTVTATAPFQKLGLGMLGAPLKTDSSLSHALPQGAALALEVSLGSQSLTHRNLDAALRTDELPTPFAKPVRSALDGAHQLLDVLGERAIVAVYIDKRGQLNLIAGARVRDDAKASEAVRTTLTGLHGAMRAHIALIGDDDDATYSATLSTGTLALGSAKGDELLVTLPLAITESDFGEVAAPLIGSAGKGGKGKRAKQQLKVVSFVQDNTVWLVVGLDAKGTAAGIVRGSVGKDLEAQGGLGKARAQGQGCQLCATADLKELLRLYLVVAQAAGETGDASKALAELGRARIESSISMGARVSASDGDASLILPKEVLYADPVAVGKVRQLVMSAAPDESTSRAAGKSAGKTKAKPSR